MQCEWTSLAGVSFDLKALTKAANDQSYYIKDGDIPCTPEEEPTFSYVWNFCSKVTSPSYPDKTVCDESVEQGAVLQYIDRVDGYKECHVIGRYDASNDDLFFNLLHDLSSRYDADRCRNVEQFSYRVSLISLTILSVTSHHVDLIFYWIVLTLCPFLFYLHIICTGESCPSGALRSATIDVKCSNVEALIDSAQEPEGCQYHLVMESYHGCPKVSPQFDHVMPIHVHNQHTLHPSSSSSSPLHTRHPVALSSCVCVLDDVLSS